MGFVRSARVFLDYLLARIKYFKGEPGNFEEYAVSTFGRTLAEFNMLNYTEKIWGVPCSKLSVDWAEQRIRGLTIGSLLKNIFFKGRGPKTLVDQFYYPDMGTGLIYEAIKRRVENKNKILLGNEPEKIIQKNNKIQKVILNGGKSYKPDYLVSSIPITVFVDLLDPKPPKKVLDAAKKLKYRSQVYLFLTINKPSVTKDQWVYFPDKIIPFARISEMKNFSKKMSPRDKTPLFIEFFCWGGMKSGTKAKKSCLRWQ